MASAGVQPFPALTPGDACPGVTAEDVDYLVDVLRLDSNKTESDLDEEIIAKASALGIDVGSPRLGCPTPRASASTSSLSPCQTRDFAPSSVQSSATSRSSVPDAFSGSSAKGTLRPRRWSGALDFSIYDEYVAQLGPNISQPKFAKASGAADDEAPQTRKKGGMATLKNGIMTLMPWGRKSSKAGIAMWVSFLISPARLCIVILMSFYSSCVCCREEFDQPDALHNLPCGHTYCSGCLTVMIDQAILDETKMPPRCCTSPIPRTTLESLLDPDERLLFLKAVVQFDTPWDLRIFCPKSTCEEFIPPRHNVDPKRPSLVACRKCDTAVCSLCKREAHGDGRDCPDDWDLDAVLRMGEKSGWRRCYRCRTLVELAQGCTHMTCRCKAEFCYICGAVWDPVGGCPNLCNEDEEMERRRAQGEALSAARDAEEAARADAEEAEAAARRDAEERTAKSPEFNELRDAQAAEQERLAAYAKKKRNDMWSRQLQMKLALGERHADQMAKMRERHAKTVSHLEDRQLRAEMSLRETLDQSERIVQIRLRHMEAYCEGLGQDSEPDMPARVVTERDLRELGQQYNVRDGMERMHRSRINVMRDKQMKAAEELEERQEEEWERLAEKREGETEGMEAGFALEEEELGRVLGVRAVRLRRRWVLAAETLRRRLEMEKGVTYAGIPVPECRVSESDVEGSIGAGEVSDAADEDC